MSYDPPSLRVAQELVSQPGANTLPLHACIFAPRYGLHRYSEEDEQALLGAYDPATGIAATDWPDTVGGVIDVATAVVRVKDAVLRYLQAIVDGSAGPTVGLVDVNKIRFPTLVFKTGNGYTRTVSLGNRDVAVGDYIKVDNGAIEILTKVLGLEADVVAAAVAATAAASGNTASQTQSESIVTNFASGLITGSADASSFSGLIAGFVTETYVCTVIESDGTLEGSKVRIDSLSGLDDVASQDLSASGVPTACGALGAAFTLVDTTYSSSSSSSSSSSTPLIDVGDTFTVSVAQDYTTPVLTSGGTYIGSQDTTYVVTILSGGIVGTDAVSIQVTTTNGIDGSIPKTFSVGGVVTIGNLGVTMTFSALTQLVTGDTFTVACTATAAGAYRTVITASDLTGMTGNDVLTCDFGLYKDIILSTVYWVGTEDDIAIAAAAEYDDNLLGLGEQAYPLLAGDVYVDYRELITAGANVLASLTDVLDIEAAVGPISALNPLALMLWASLTGSAGTAVYYVQTSGNSLQDYMDAAGVVSPHRTPWSFVPYSVAKATLQALETLVNADSAEERAIFRKLYAGIDQDRTIVQYTKQGGNDLLATLSGTTLTCSTALFSTQGIVPGDFVRINYRLNSQGVMIYDTYTVDSVTSNTVLELTTAATLPIVIASKMEVWRTLSLQLYAEAIADQAEEFTNRRVSLTWCQKLTILEEEDISRAYLAAFIAGVRSANAPHQPLSRVPLSGISIEDVTPFTDPQLDVIAGAGTWIVIKDLDGTIYTRHQLTTDMSDVSHREDSVTSNVDSLCRDFRESVKDLYGRGNVSTAMLELIRSRIYSKKSAILARDFDDIIGPQIQNLTITKLYIDPVNRDWVWCVMDMDVPEPMNHLSLKFRIF